MKTTWKTKQTAGGWTKIGFDLISVPAEVDQVDKSSEVFDLIGQQVCCRVRRGKDMGCIVGGLANTKTSSRDYSQNHRARRSFEYY